VIHESSKDNCGEALEFYYAAPFLISHPRQPRTMPDELVNLQE
ncbi:hypothetical protein A2U01_0005971, partial [Trifolium medium]|nr:hypothetical protein [Trifolium medium]